MEFSLVFVAKSKAIVDTAKFQGKRYFMGGGKNFRNED